MLGEESSREISGYESSFKTIVLFIISSLVIILLFLYLFQINLVQSFQENSWGLIHRTLLLNVMLLFGLVYGILIKFAKMRLIDFGLEFDKLPLAIAAGVFIWVSVHIIESIASYLIHGAITFEFLWITESTTMVGLFIGMLFGTALFEEIGFRGFLLIQFIKKFQKYRSNRILLMGLALLTSQTLFTTIHIPWKVMEQGLSTTIVPELIFSVFLNGVIFGLIYLRTRNLFFVIAIHALGNAPSLFIKPLIDPSLIILLIAAMLSLFWPRTTKKINISLLKKRKI